MAVKNLVLPAESVTEEWSPKDRVVAAYIEKVLGNLVSQLGHDHHGDVILACWFMGFIVGKDSQISDDVARAMWRMTEDMLGKSHVDAIRGATGGFVLQLRKVIRQAG